MAEDAGRKEEKLLTDSTADELVAMSSTVKPLPVLDLLELNNHLLRLKAATRDSGHAALDHLADLEVASQFAGEEQLLAPPLPVSLDIVQEPVINVCVEKSDNRPSWLNELLKLANGERESNSSLSDEGCVADSAELRYSPPPPPPLSPTHRSQLEDKNVVMDEVKVSSASGIDCTSQIEFHADDFTATTEATQRKMSNNSVGGLTTTSMTPSTTLLERKTSSKRRRRSSSLALSATFHDSVGVRNKSNSTNTAPHSITFPDKPPTSSSDNNVAAELIGDGLSLAEDEGERCLRPVLTAQLSTSSQVDSQLATDESVSSDMFVDAFESIGDETEIGDTTAEPHEELKTDSVAVSLLTAAIQQIVTDENGGQNSRAPSAKVSFSLGDGPPVRLSALAAVTNSQRSSADSNDLDDDLDDVPLLLQGSTAVDGRFLVVGPVGSATGPELKTTQDDEAESSSRSSSDDDDDEEERNRCISHRSTVAMSLTIAPDQPVQESPLPPPLLSCSPTPQQLRTASPSPFNPELDGSYSSSPVSSSTEKMKQQLQQQLQPLSRQQQQQQQQPKRYGLKRRPLRGPYGEMLEAEMNKSEFGKMYTKRAEDLSYLLTREPVGLLSSRLNRDVKSTSPRPLSPTSPSSSPIGGLLSAASGVTEPSSSSGSGSAATVRQNSLPLPTSHSLDDSQLKVGYNTTGSSSTLPAGLPASVALTGSTGSVLPKRKVSANLPYVFSDGDLELSVATTTTGGNKSNRPHHPSPLSMPTHSSGGSSSAVGHLLNSTAAAVSAPLAHHQRTSSSPCQLIFTEAGFTSEDEPELLELTSLSTLSRSTAQLLQPDAASSGGSVNNKNSNLNSTSSMSDRHTLPLTRVGSAKRSRVSHHHFFLLFFLVGFGTASIAFPGGVCFVYLLSIV